MTSATAEPTFLTVPARSHTICINIFSSKRQQQCLSALLHLRLISKGLQVATLSKIPRTISLILYETYRL